MNLFKCVGFWKNKKKYQSLIFYYTYNFDLNAKIFGKWFKKSSDFCVYL